MIGLKPTGGKKDKIFCNKDALHIKSCVAVLRLVSHSVLCMDNMKTQRQWATYQKYLFIQSASKMEIWMHVYIA